MIDIDELAGRAVSMEQISQEIKFFLDNADPEELAILDNVLASCGFVPDNEFQAQAYYTDADITFFGGKAGTGKSYLLLGLAAYEHVNTVIFRQHFAQFKGGDGMLAKAIDIIGNSGSLNRIEGVYSNVFGEKTIEFAGLSDGKGVAKHKGRARDLYAFDEITEINYDDFISVIGWMRTTRIGQRTRVVCTGNPPTDPQGEWVLKFWGPWLDPDYEGERALPGELRWFAVIDGEYQEVDSGKEFSYKKERIKPLSRTFIAGEMVSYLKKTGYDKVLQNLPEPLRSKLLHGDFSIRADDDLYQVCPTAWIDLAVERWKATKRNGAMTAIGVDVARGGKDKTCFAPLFGNFYEPVIDYPGKVTKTGGDVVTLLEKTIEKYSDEDGIKHDPDRRIDVIGVGSAVADNLRDNRKEYTPVNFAEGSMETDKSGELKLANKRTESYWKFREALDPEDGDDICLPPDNDLRNDLRSARYKVTTRGIMVYSKDEIRKQLKRSPDKGDSVILAWGKPGKPIFASSQTEEKVKAINNQTRKSPFTQKRKSRIW